jgi:hypothetical protein
MGKRFQLSRYANNLNLAQGFHRTPGLKSLRHVLWAHTNGKPVRQIHGDQARHRGLRPAVTSF